MKARITLLLLALLCTTATTSFAERPNIIFIYADDWGWGDLSAHGHPWLKTPRIDRLAEEGINFQQFNVVNPVCSPSRAGAMTGMYPARFCIHGHFARPDQNAARGMPDWLDPEAPTLPRLLKQAGYRTGHFGKWHLTNGKVEGAPVPTAYGIDEAAVFNGGNWSSWGAGLHDTASNTAAFIKANADQPFFINVWIHETHTPHLPRKTSMDTWKDLDEQEQVYAAVVTDGDDDVGTILDALEEAGVADNTLVIFSSDNGPERTGKKPGKPRTTKDGEVIYGTWCSVGVTGGLRGRKRSLFEGGVRVPFIVRWPGQAPAGTTNDTTVVTAVDLLPTLCAAAGVELPDDYRGDGENLLDAFHGKEVTRTKPIFWEWRGPKVGDLWPRLAVRDGDWKLVMTHDGSRVELYQLSDDRAESNDVAGEHPEIVERLKVLVLEWKASLPEKPNPSCISVADRAKE